MVLVTSKYVYDPCIVVPEKLEKFWSLHLIHPTKLRVAERYEVLVRLKTPHFTFVKADL